MRKTWNVYLRIALLFLGVIILAEAQASEYDVVERFKELEDKFKTHEMLNPIGHDFVFDVGLLLNKDLFDVIDDVDKVSDTQGSTAAKLSAAQNILRKYDKTEQNVRLHLNLGFPLPTFHAFGVKIIPDFRTHVGVGALLGFRATSLTISQILANIGTYVGSDVPAAVATKLQQSACAAGMTNGTDIVQHLIDTSACGLSAAEITAITPLVGKYKIPSDTTVPDIFNYAKAEAKVGFNFGYEYGEKWFGTFNLYGMGRADMKVRVSADSIAAKGEVADLGEELNTTMYLSADYRLGYKNGNLRTWFALEELKLSELSNNEEKAGALNYGTDPLIRLHGEYMYKLSFFSVKPFGGVHKRSGYGLGNGIYGGADLGLHVWQERLGLRFRGMLDSEHFTFSPMAKLWFMSVEYMLKTPIKSEIDGVKPSTLHSVNFRLAF
ncbi:hypothetical protein OAT67_01420 [Bacteriovoracaceae bacterium]|nr:hypothetical protein [Bacteriovoracaceae bacterium]